MKAQNRRSRVWDLLLTQTVTVLSVMQMRLCLEDTGIEGTVIERNRGEVMNVKNSGNPTRNDKYSMESESNSGNRNDDMKIIFF